LIHALSSDTEFPVFPIVTMPNTSPESEAVQREKMLLILEAVIALVDDDSFDFDPNETPESHFDGALS
jgi:hypothetical protein